MVSYKYQSTSVVAGSIGVLVLVVLSISLPWYTLQVALYSADFSWGVFNTDQSAIKGFAVMAILAAASALLVAVLVVKKFRKLSFMHVGLIHLLTSVFSFAAGIISFATIDSSILDYGTGQYLIIVAGVVSGVLAFYEKFLLSVPEPELPTMAQTVQLPVKTRQQSHDDVGKHYEQGQVYVQTTV